MKKHHTNQQQKTWLSYSKWKFHEKNREIIILLRQNHVADG